MSDFEIPDLPLEVELENEANSEEIKDESNGASTYAFLGSGQGGCRIAEAFYNIGYKKTLCINTAKQDLANVNLPDEQKVLLDAGEQGAGKNMRNGEEAAEKGQQTVYELMVKKFGNKVDHVFVCAGAGGGSGGGSVLVLVETAKKYLTYIGVPDADQRVGVLLTLPTTGECASPSVASNAIYVTKILSSLAQKKLISPLIIIDNDKIKKLYPNLTVKKFWPTVNATVAGLFHIFNVIPTKNTEYTTFDVADYMSVMRGGGCMIMGVTSVKDLNDSNSVSKSLKGNLEKTLLASGFDLRTASHAAAVVVGGTSIFENTAGLMNSIEEGFDTLAVMTGNAMVHRGIYEDDKDRLNVYTLVGGLSSPLKRIDELLKFQNGMTTSTSNVEKDKSTMPLPAYGNRLYKE